MCVAAPTIPHPPRRAGAAGPDSEHALPPGKVVDDELQAMGPIILPRVRTARLPSMHLTALLPHAWPHGQGRALDVDNQAVFFALLQESGDDSLNGHLWFRDSRAIGHSIWSERYVPEFEVHASNPGTQI